jgi:hypothetical protein
MNEADSIRLARKSLDVPRTFEKADFEKTLRTRLELFKVNKLNGLLLKFSSVDLPISFKKTFRPYGT